MPANVPLASPTTVLPKLPFRALRQTRTVAVDINEYPDGSSQCSALVGQSRRMWEAESKLTPTLLTTLQTFYLARKGRFESFYFYDPYESDPFGFYDATGNSPNGRCIVHFHSALQVDCELGRPIVRFRLEEGA